MTHDQEEPHDPNSALSTQGLTLQYGTHRHLTYLNLSVAGGRITSLIGANGCGKSTLLRALSRLLARRAARCCWTAGDLHRLPARRWPATVILPQGPVAPEGLTVEQLAWFGRHPHQGCWGCNDHDREGVGWALAQTGMTAFAPARSTPSAVGSGSGPGSP